MKLLKLLLIVFLAGYLLTVQDLAFAAVLTQPQDFKAVRYADSDEASIKYATLVWDPVEGASSYNLYSVGSSDIFFDSSSTNTYTLKFDSTSSWYFKVTAVNKEGLESPKSGVLTVSYPNPVSGKNLEIPKNLRITQIETTKDPNIFNVHIMWDPVNGATSYIIYTNAGSSFYYHSTVDTNLYEMKININSVFYIAVSAAGDGLESARSQIFKIEIPRTTSGKSYPPANPPQTTVIVTGTTKKEIIVTPANSDESVQRLKQLEQDVKNLKAEVAQQEEKQRRTETIIDKITGFLRSIFRLNI